MFNRRKDDGILPQKIQHDGYATVDLIGPDGKKVTRYMHELVAKAYVPNPENKKYVRHKDGNKLNNYAENLEWCDEPEL